MAYPPPSLDKLQKVGTEQPGGVGRFGTHAAAGRWALVAIRHRIPSVDAHGPTIATTPRPK